MNIATEKRNPNSMNLDILSIKETIALINQEDQKVALAVKECSDAIELAIQEIIQAFNNGGRLIYLGAGTSGRLGVLDTVECYPTFGVGDNQVCALMAGGEKAFVKAQEGAEDSKELAINDLKNIGVNNNDVVCGIAASGRTPYVIGALEYAKSLSCKTIAITCNPGSIVGQTADIAIEPNPGPEVLTGSTRMKAGTCQKLVLNMLSTISMVNVGKVYENLMIDLKITNEKLENRAKQNIMLVTHCTLEEATVALQKSNNDVKTAILIILLNCSVDEAKAHIQKSGSIRKIINSNEKK